MFTLTPFQNKRRFISFSIEVILATRFIPLIAGSRENLSNRGNLVKTFHSIPRKVVHTTFRVLRLERIYPSLITATF